MIALRFGGVDVGTYTFPIYNQSIDARSASLNVPTQQLPNTSGAWPGLGYGSQPVQPKTISLSFVIRADTRSEMEALRDDLNAIASWGNQRLYAREDGKPERYINCFVQSIQMAQNANNHTNLHQPVTIIFLAIDPYWYGASTEAATWGGGAAWGAFIWGTGGSAGPLAETCVGMVTDFTLTNDGNAPVNPRFVVTVEDGDTTANLRISRVVGGVVKDKLQTIATLIASGVDRTLDIDCSAKSVTLDGLNLYTDSNWQQPLNLWWFKLLPGANLIRVEQNNSGHRVIVNPIFSAKYL